MNNIETTMAAAAQAAENVGDALAELAEELAAPPAVTLDELDSMDMTIFYSDEEKAARPEWRITDDSCADWALQKIREEREELNRIRELAAEQMARIDMKLAAAERRYENGTNFLTAKLAEYFNTVPHKKTKTTESYRLLSGTLKMKLGGTTMKQDDEKLLEYLKSSGNEDMIAIAEKPKWGEFKKRLSIIAGQVVDASTGEIVEGVEIVQNPDKFTVDI